MLKCGDEEHKWSQVSLRNKEMKVKYVVYRYGGTTESTKSRDCLIPPPLWGGSSLGMGRVGKELFFSVKTLFLFGFFFFFKSYAYITFILIKILST